MKYDTQTAIAAIKFFANAPDDNRPRTDAEVALLWLQREVRIADKARVAALEDLERARKEAQACAEVEQRHRDKATTLRDLAEAICAEAEAEGMVWDEQNLIFTPKEKP